MLLLLSLLWDVGFGGDGVGGGGGKKLSGIEGFGLGLIGGLTETRGENEVRALRKFKERIFFVC